MSKKREVWRPVTGNVYGRLEVTREGRLFVDYYNDIGQPISIDTLCPPELRLCRPDDAEPVAGVVPVPEEVREAIMAMLTVDGMQYYPLTAEIIREWLDSLRGAVPHREYGGTAQPSNNYFETDEPRDNSLWQDPEY